MSMEVTQLDIESSVLRRRFISTEDTYFHGDSLVSLLSIAGHILSRNQEIKHAPIPRTRYYFSINGPGKKERLSLALERERWPIFFFVHNFGVQLIPFKVGN